MKNEVWASTSVLRVNQFLDNCCELADDQHFPEIIAFAGTCVLSATCHCDPTHCVPFHCDPEVIPLRSNVIVSQCSLQYYCSCEPKTVHKIIKNTFISFIYKLFYHVLLWQSGRQFFSRIIGIFIF